jgi:HEPN domain-containing protein
MKSKSDLVKAWCANAEGDLAVARNELGPDPQVYFAVCFHAQQAAEKFLKAYTIHLDLEPRHIHEIGDLIEVITAKDPGLRTHQAAADILTSYAVEIRYPDTMYTPSRAEAAKAVQLAESIRGYVVARLTPPA